MKYSKIYVALILAIASANTEGFTIDAQTLQPVTTGYAVATEATQNSFNRDGLINVISYVNSHDDVTAIGGWYDSESGRTYYDGTIIVDNLAQAIELGKKNHQLAIFDLANGREIRL